jgi:hypothetical protein
MLSPKHFSFLSFSILSLFTLTNAQFNLPDPGCKTLVSIARSCTKKLDLTTAAINTETGCICYDGHSSYQPSVWDNAVQTCYEYMSAHRTELATMDIYSLNGGTAYPETFSEIFAGICTNANAASGPASASATLSGGSAVATSSGTVCLVELLGK